MADPGLQNTSTGDSSLARIQAELAAACETELGGARANLAAAAACERAAALLRREETLQEAQALRAQAQARVQELEGLLRELTGAAPSGVPPVLPPTSEAPAPAAPAAGNGVAARGAAAAEAPPAAPVAPAAPTAPVRTLASAARSVPIPSAALAAPVVELPPRPVYREWMARDLEELEVEREAIAESVAALDPNSEIALMEFKACCARFQGAMQERRRHPGLQSNWNTQIHELRDWQRAFWGTAYCLPLVPAPRLIPEEWRELAAAYGYLASAQEALEWVEEVLPHQPRPWLERDCTPLLEACGAAVTLFQRWMNVHLPEKSDPQQRALAGRLDALVRPREHAIMTRLFGDSVTTEQLVSLAGEIEARCAPLRRDAGLRVRQTEGLEWLHSLLSRPDLGHRAEDADRLCDAVFECLDARIPATDRRLRDGLLDYGWMLEDDPRVEPMHRAVAAEQERLERRTAGSAEESEDSEGELSADVQEMLGHILPGMQDRKGVIVGGVCREKNRAAIERAFQLAELRWPSTSPTDPFERSLQEISRADVVFLTRFNRKASREAFRFCHEQKKVLVILPKGYGLNQVIRQTYLTLQNRT